jgi:hypothetical protein
MAEHEIKQLEHQIEGAKYQLKAAQLEIKSTEKEIENNISMNTFMKEKFSNQQLYQWMAGKLAAMFFQTYKLAFDMAKSAERAFWPGKVWGWTSITWKKHTSTPTTAGLK